MTALWRHRCVKILAAEMRYKLLLGESKKPKRKAGEEAEEPEPAATAPAGKTTKKRKGKEQAEEPQEKPTRKRSKQQS